MREAELDAEEGALVMLPGRRYREWKRTGVLTSMPRLGVWLVLMAAAFLALMWWLSRF